MSKLVEKKEGLKNVTSQSSDSINFDKNLSTLSVAASATVTSPKVETKDLRFDFSKIKILDQITKAIHGSTVSSHIVGTHPIWPPRASILGQFAHRHLASLRIGYLATLLFTCVHKSELS